MQHVDASFFVSIALAMVAIESWALVVLHLRGSKWLLTPELIAHLASGGCLMAALKVATEHGSDVPVVALLAAAGIAHAAALTLHWRRQSRQMPAASTPDANSSRTASDTR